MKLIWDSISMIMGFCTSNCNQLKTVRQGVLLHDVAFLMLLGVTQIISDSLGGRWVKDHVTKCHKGEGELKCDVNFFTFFHVLMYCCQFFWQVKFKKKCWTINMYINIILIFSFQETKNASFSLLTVDDYNFKFQCYK